MAWEQGQNSAGADYVMFTCDSPDCNDGKGRNVSLSPEAFRNADTPAHVTNFAVCWTHIQTKGWRSFKRGGRPWEYFCPACAPAAEAAQREYNRQEAERERIKARNAR